MDANHHKFSNPTWELEMAMENQILHDHDKVPLGALWPNNYNPLHQDHHPISSVLLNQLPSSSDFNMGEINNNHQFEEQDPEEEELGTMKEMMFKIAAMQPVNIDPTTIRKPKRRNVRISDDPQSVAARHRRERISEKMRILQRLVPGGTKMDTASMLEEAGRYIKFLKRQIQQLQANHQPNCIGVMDCLSAGEWLVAANKPLGGSTGSCSMEPVAGCTLGSDGAAPAGGHEHLSCNDHEVIN